jgi:coenzyme F420-reducing hydrogenase beta subunit
VDETFSGFDEELERVEKRIFGMTRKEVFGVYRKIFVVDELDGGEVSPEEAIIKEIMKMGLRKRYFEAVGFGGYGDPATPYLLMQPRGRWEAAAVMATKPEELDNVRMKPLTPGMLYNAVRGLYEEMVNGFFYGVDPVRIALFGSPQHIRSVWRIRFSWSEHKKLSKTIVLAASHFERPFYSYSELKKLLLDKGVNLDEVGDWRFEEDGLSLLVGDKWVKYSYESLSPAMYKGFKTLRDPTGEFADFSVGKVSGIDGLVIIGRSEEGVRLVEEAVGEGILKELDFDLDRVLDGLRGLYG